TDAVIALNKELSNDDKFEPVIEGANTRTKCVSDLCSAVKRFVKEPIAESKASSKSSASVTSRRPETCFSCNGVGHWAKDCPHNNVSRKNREASPVRSAAGAGAGAGALPVRERDYDNRRFPECRHCKTMGKGSFTNHPEDSCRNRRKSSSHRTPYPHTTRALWSASAFV